MKPVYLDVPSRDIGKPTIRPLATKLIERLEDIERRLAPEGERAPSLSAERSLLERLEGRGDAIAMERQRVLQRAIDEMYFSIVIAPGVSFYEGGGVTEQLNNGSVTMRFPDGVNTNFASRQEPTRQLWVKTRPRVYVWYTSTVAGAANFTFNFALWVFGPGLTTVGTLVSGAALQWNAAGPTGANDVLMTTAVMSTSFPSSPYGVTRARIGRIGAGDANNNALDVLLTLVVFEEVA